MRWLARKSLSQYYYPSLRLLFQKHSPPWSIYLNIFQGDLLIDFPRFLMTGLTWCGKKEGSGMDYKSCPYECSKQKPFWGHAAAKVSGKTNKRVLMLIRLAQDQTRRWLYPEMQGWKKVLYVFGVREKRSGEGREGQEKNMKQTRNRRKLQSRLRWDCGLENSTLSILITWKNFILKRVIIWTFPERNVSLLFGLIKLCELLQSRFQFHENLTKKLNVILRFAKVRAGTRGISSEFKTCPI